MQTPIKGLTKAEFQLKPDDHGVTHVFGLDARMSGGKYHFDHGVRICGTLSEVEEIVCAGTLIIDSAAKVNAKSIQAECLINLGELRGNSAKVSGTLVAWSGSIQVAVIEYGALEMSSDCAVKGTLDKIVNAEKPVTTAAIPTLVNPYSTEQKLDSLPLRSVG